MDKMISSEEKRAILKDILGVDYQDRTLPALSMVIDYTGTVNDGLALAELIPYLNRYLTGPVASRVVSSSSLVGTLLFPVGAVLQLIDANNTGHSMYAYRAAAYSVTAWAYNDPIPTGSLRILSNIRSGPVVQSNSVVAEYKELWAKVSRDVLAAIKQTCQQRNVPEDYLKILFRAVSNGDRQNLCVQILKSFENRFSPTTIHIWRSNYSIPYPV